MLVRALQNSSAALNCGRPQERAFSLSCGSRGDAADQHQKQEWVLPGQPTCPCGATPEHFMFTIPHSSSL
eukprot:3634357-Prymnesium_polylepis.1